MKNENMINLALTLEKFLIPTTLWDQCEAPQELVEKAKEHASNGYSTGIAYHPRYGWFGLGTGQGPYVWWYENRNEFDKLLEAVGV